MVDLPGEPMGCACGKPFVIEDSRGSPRQRLPASRLPAAAAPLQADAPAKRMAAAVSSLMREEVVGVRVDAVAQVVAVEKRVGSGPIRANGMDADRRRVMERPAQRSHPMQVIGTVPKAVEGEQVAAGWPPWLAAVAGEAIRGWVPRRADSFEKLDKVSASLGPGIIAKYRHYFSVLWMINYSHVVAFFDMPFLHNVL